MRSIKKMLFLVVLLAQSITYAFSNPLILEASRAYNPSVVTDGIQNLTEPIKVTVPSSINVTSGNAAVLNFQMQQPKNEATLSIR